MKRHVNSFFKRGTPSMESTKQLWMIIKSKRPGKLTMNNKHVLGFNGYCTGLWLWTGWWLPMFFRFGPMWLASFPQYEKKTPGWEPVSQRWLNHCCCWWRFVQQDESLFTNGMQAHGYTEVSSMCTTRGIIL